MSNEQIGRGIIELEVREEGVTAAIAKVDAAVAGLGQTAAKAGTEAGAGIDKIGQGAEKAAGKTEQSGQRVKKTLASLREGAAPAEAVSGSLEKIGDAGNEAARKLDAATRNMISSIQRTTVTMRVGDRNSAEYFRVLAGQRGVDVGALEPYLKQLEAVSARQVRVGLTAGEMSNAMRMLPAQFTDIATSLAGGQDPMLVLIQQGGQLKDSFGGVGPAAKAMATYVLGLVTPLTVTAAAFAAIGYEIYRVNEQFKAFNVAMAATNYFSGMTEQQFAMLAEKISATGLASSAMAKEIASGLTLSGKYSAETIEKMSVAIVQYAEVTGKKSQEVSGKLSSMFEDPLKAAKDLDEQFHIMSYTEQEYVKQLVEAGKQQEAVQFTLDKLTDRLKGPAAEALTWYTSLWNKLVSAMDAAEIKRRRDAAIDAIQQTMGPSSNLTHLEARAKAEAIYESDQRAISSAARREAERLQDAARGKEQAAFLDKEHEKFKSKAQERLDFAKKIREAETEAAAAAKGLTLAQLKAYNDKTIAAFNEQHKDPGGRKSSAFGKAEDREVADLRARIEAENQIAGAMRQNGAAYEKMTEGAKLALKFRQQEGVAVTDAAKANLRLRASLADELGYRQELTKALMEQISVQKALDEADQRRAGEQDLQSEDVRKQLEFLTMNMAQREKAQAAWEAEKETKRQLLDLQIKLNQARADEAAASTPGAKAVRSKIVDDLEGEKRLLQMEGAKKVEAAVQAVNDRLAMGSNWVVSSRRALEDYADNAINIADEVGAAWTRGMGGMEDALTKFVMTGKSSFKDLANSIIEDMIRIQIRQSITGPLAQALPGLLSFTRSGPPAPIEAGTVMASGGAWLRGVQMFANGGAFTNSIVSKPTAFSHAGGLGVMGEAGPEAIMPLTRDAAGRLGVRTAGNAGAAPSVDVQVNVINQSSQPLQAQQQGQPRIDQFGKVIIDMIVTDVRRGGPVSSTMEAAYGLRRGGR
ncbi:phage tail tape measure protein [Chromobacterium sp.]|uniref:phage tail tape measure protein n=1 Tax=Chromobacterium sp. TaxID=306190 RepID=UPI0035AFDEC3